MDLALLAGLNSDHGWRTNLAKHLGITRERINGWIVRGRISKDGIHIIEEKGYPREKWLNKRTSPSAQKSIKKPYTGLGSDDEKFLKGVIAHLQKKKKQSTEQELSEDEQALIESYRLLDHERRVTLAEYLKILVGAVSKKKTKPQTQAIHNLDKFISSAK